MPTEEGHRSGTLGSVIRLLQALQAGRGTPGTPFAVLDLQRGAHKLLALSHPSVHIAAWRALPRWTHSLLHSGAIRPSPQPSGHHTISRSPKMPSPRLGHLSKNRWTPSFDNTGFSEKHHWALQTQRPASGRPSQGLVAFAKVKSCGPP